MTRGSRLKRLDHLEAEQAERCQEEREALLSVELAQLSAEELEARLSAAGIPTRAEVAAQDAELRARLFSLSPEELQAEAERARADLPELQRQVNNLLR